MFVEIVDVVRDYLTAAGLQAEVVDGIDSRDAQVDFGRFPDGRVAFVPVPGPIAITEPKFIGEGDEDDDGRVRRQLLNVMFAYEVSVAGYDIDNAERDLAHRHACFDLWERVVQAMQAAYYGSHEWTVARWEDARKYGRHGAELVATLTVNLPIFDVTYPTASPEPVAGDPKPEP
jgi:hypothetical protein